MNRTMITGLVAGLVLTACGERKTEQDRMAGMGNMAGNAMAMRSDSLMPLMRAHLDSLATLAPHVGAGMLRLHDAMTSQILDAMGGDMTMMNMRPDSPWTALTDSVKRDLAELPVMSGRTLETRVNGHVGRMRRLLDMHATMMRR